MIKTKIKQIKRCRILYLMVIPGMLAIFIFHYIPLYGVVMAFKDYRPSQGFLGSEFVGLKHFKAFMNYPYFWKMVWNTLRISLWSWIGFPLPIILAIMYNELKNIKIKRVCQTISYAPHFVSTVVVCSMVSLFCSRDGLINIIIQRLGGSAIDFLSEPLWFAPIYTISGIWSGLGWGTILYLAALSAVSVELVEAARIDGAGRLNVIWHVYLPQLIPTIVIQVLFKLGGMLSVGFEKTFLLQNPLNLEASSIISTYTYGTGLLDGRYSYSTAVGLFDNIINIILVIAANTIVKKISHNELGLW